MFNFNVVTLKDGTQLNSTTFESLWTAIQGIEKTDEEALLELVEKCHDAKECIPSGRESPKILKEHNLVDQDETVPLLVQQIVLNAVEGSGYWTELVNPLAEKEVSLISVKS